MVAAAATGPRGRVLGLEALGEQQASQGKPADCERDLNEIVNVAIAEHDMVGFDVIHAQYGYPTGPAALEVSRRTGIPNVVSIESGDRHGVGRCCLAHRAAAVGVRDCIEHERNGLLVPIRDSAALAAAMVRLFDDRALRQQLADQGLRDVHSPYCWPVVVR